MSNFIELKNLEVSYDKKQIVLQEVNVSIAEKKFVAIIGANGSGKSTIIKAVLGLTPYKGNILFKNKNIRKIKRKELAKHIAYVPQILSSGGEITVYDYISFSRYPYTKNGFLSQKDKTIIENIISKMKLKYLEDKMIDQISGGQRQKVAVASALVQEAEVIILDEPTTYLDINNQYEILEIMDLLKEQDKTVITVLHDLNHVISYCDEVIVVNEKSVIAQGDPQKIINKSLIKKIYGVDAKFVDVDKKQHLTKINTEEIRKELKWF